MDVLWSGYIVSLNAMTINHIRKAKVKVSESECNEHYNIEYLTILCNCNTIVSHVIFMY